MPWRTTCWWESFPLQLLRSLVRLALSFITHKMTILYILHKKTKSCIVAMKNKLLRIYFTKIHLLHHSLDTAHINTHRLKVLCCASADRSPDLKLLSCCQLCWTVAISLTTCLSRCPPEVFGWVKTFIFLLQKLFMCILRDNNWIST